MFEISVKTSFQSSHALRFYHGADEPLHAHRFVAEVVISAADLDEAGCAMDFAEADRILAAWAEPFRKKPVNEAPEFLEASPSAENMAASLFRFFSKSMDSKRARILRATIWEDESHSAAFVNPEASR